MMSDVGNQEENPAEPVPDVATVAEPPQPPEPLTEDEALRTTPTSSNVENIRIDVPERDLHAPATERRDKFAQTFVKYAKNLSNRRLVEIINTQIDRIDKTQVFYCTSDDLIRSFEDGITPARKQHHE